MRKKLMPCPECGSNNLSLVTHHKEVDYFSIRCNECFYSTWLFRYSKNLLDDWETRRRSKNVVKTLS